MNLIANAYLATREILQGAVSRRWISGICLLLVFTGTLPGEAPEFYGVYSGGKGEWVELTAGEEDQKAGPTVTPETRFLIYLPSMSSAGTPDEIAKLQVRGRVDRIVEKIGLVDDHWEYRLHPNDGSRFAVFEKSVPMRMKPGPRKGSFEVVPSEPLPVGYYALEIDRKWYPFVVSEGDETPGGYEHWFETTASASFWDQFGAMSERGMLRRNSINGRAIKEDYFRPAGTVDRLLVGNIMAGQQDYLSGSYRDAYLRAYGLRHLLKEKFGEGLGGFQKILDEAPIKALEALEEDPPEDLPERLDFWVKVTNGRPDVAERAKSLRYASILARARAAAATGDAEAFEEATRSAYGPDLPLAVRLSLKDLREEIAFETAAEEAERLLESGRIDEARVEARRAFFLRGEAEGTEELVRRILGETAGETPVRASLFAEERKAQPWTLPGECQVAFSADGSDLHLFKSYGGAETLARWDLATGNLRFLNTGKRALGKQLSLGGPVIVAGTKPGRPSTSTTWNGRSEQRYEFQYAVPGDHSIRTRSFTVKENFEGFATPDGRKIVLIPRSRNRNEFPVLEVDTGSGDVGRYELKFSGGASGGGFSGPIAVCFDRDSRFAGAVFHDKIAMIDLKEGRVKWKKEGVKGIGKPLGVTGDGRFVHYLPGAFGGDWMVYNSTTGRQTKLFKGSDKAYAFSEQANIGLITDYDEVLLFRLSDGHPLGSLNPGRQLDPSKRGRQVRSADLSPDGRRIAVSFPDGEVAVFAAKEVGFEGAWEDLQAERTARLPWVGVWKNQSDEWYEYSGDGSFRSYGRNGKPQAKGTWRLEGDEFILEYAYGRSRFTVVQISPESYTIRSGRQTYHGYRQGGGE